MSRRKINLDELPTFESILDRIDTVSPWVSSFELVLPHRMTYHKRLLYGHSAKALILDRLLQKGFALIEETTQDHGIRLFKFAPESPFDPSELQTEPPPLDITQQIPALAPLEKTCIRLHPRRTRDTDPLASKLGGTFLWPRSEPWPCCDDHRHQTGVQGSRSATDGISPILVGIAQLNARDSPSVPFPLGKDLFQLLWCPSTEEVHHDYEMFPKVFSYWRESSSITDPLPAHPLPNWKAGNNLYPVTCRFYPEEVQELPTLAGLENLPNHTEIHDALSSDEAIWNLYQNELAACPATKMGGHPFWIQNDETPRCECGEKMELLLQLCDWEYTNMRTTQRWIPLADRWAVNEWESNPTAEAIFRPPHFDFGHEVYYIFVCCHCPERRVQFHYQR